MKIPLLTILVITLILLTGCAKTVEEKIDDLMANYSGDKPGAAVMVVKDGKILFQKGYGLANLETDEKIFPETNLRLASISKQFTAMSILLLSEQGKLNLEDKLNSIFPAFPNYAKKITIKNLLQHTSGLVDYESLIPDTATIQVSDADVLNMMYGVDSLYFEPGTKFQYSNTGYAVLAMIVEKLSGKDFSQFMKENIFTPVGMDNSVGMIENKYPATNRAYGYNNVEGKFDFSDQSLTSAVLGDGGVYTSLNDMYKWDQLLYTDKLLKPENMKLYFTRGKLHNGVTIDYALGWRRGTYKNLDKVYHPGSTCGFRNIYNRYHEKKLSVLILTNRRGPDPAEIADKITNLFLD